MPLETLITSDEWRNAYLNEGEGDSRVVAEDSDLPTRYYVWVKNASGFMIDIHYINKKGRGRKYRFGSVQGKKIYNVAIHWVMGVYMYCVVDKHWIDDVPVKVSSDGAPWSSIRIGWTFMRGIYVSWTK